MGSDAEQTHNPLIGPFETFSYGQLAFAATVSDVRRLLEDHDAVTGKKRGRPKDDLDVYKRAAVILLVTAWETYIEDVLRSEFGERLAAAKDPDMLGSTFNAVAHAWLEKKPKPPALSSWTGDGWKAHVRESFECDLDRLHTPSAKEVRRLSKKYLGGDLTKTWHWPKNPPKRVVERLQAFINLRGGLVHRAKSPFVEKAAAVKREDVEDGLDLMERLVDATEKGVRPK